jgi:hypothetical protein
MDDGLHWAICDTESDKEGNVSCAYLVLDATYPECCDGQPLSAQSMPRRIANLLNAEGELERLRDERIGSLSLCQAAEEWAAGRITDQDLRASVAHFQREPTVGTDHERSDV